MSLFKKVWARETGGGREMRMKHGRKIETIESVFYCQYVGVREQEVDSEINSGQQVVYLKKIKRRQMDTMTYGSDVTKQER